MSFYITTPIYYVNAQPHLGHAYTTIANDVLERLYAEQPKFVMPQRHYNEAHSFITSGLQDVSLSRAHLRWGVSVPWDPEHVFYVWFDALLNYYTALTYAPPPTESGGSDLVD